MREVDHDKTKLSALFDRVLRSILVFSLILSMGCAPTLRDSLNHRTLSTPLNSPSVIHVDVQASELRWEEPISLNFSPHRLRRNLASMIQEALNGSTRRAERVGQMSHTRFLQEVHSLHHSYGRLFLPCLFYFSFFGCPVDTIRAEITLTLDHQGELFRASSSGEATFNYFQHSFGEYPPEIRAVGVAIAEAIKMIAYRAAVPVSKHRGESR